MRAFPRSLAAAFAFVILALTLSSCNLLSDSTPTPVAIPSPTPIAAAATPTAIANQPTPTMIAADATPTMIAAGATPTTVAQVFTPTDAQQAHEDDVREAVFHGQIDGRSDKVTFCLTVDGDWYGPQGGSDPSDELMSRFKDNAKVHKGSDCAGLPTPVYGSGEEITYTGATNIIWISDTQATAQGSNYSGPMTGSGETYTVTFDGSKWTAVSSGAGWIS